MKKISILLLAAFLMSGAAFSQNYKSVKVTLDNGLIVKGKNALLGNESISLTTNTGQATYSLDEVSLIQAKQGKAASWALGCGGCCLGGYAVLGVMAASGTLQVNGEPYQFNVGSFIGETLLATGVSVGVGYLIGTLLDKDEVVYHRTSPRLSNFNLNVNSNRITKYDPITTGLTVSYKF